MMVNTAVQTTQIFILSFQEAVSKGAIAHIPTQQEPPGLGDSF